MDFFKMQLKNVTTGSSMSTFRRKFLRTEAARMNASAARDVETEYPRPHQARSAILAKWETQKTKTEFTAGAPRVVYGDRVVGMGLLNRVNNAITELMTTRTVPVRILVGGIVCYRPIVVTA
jgi:hypothetical protein